MLYGISGLADRRSQACPAILATLVRVQGSRTRQKGHETLLQRRILACVPCPFLEPRIATHALGMEGQNLVLRSGCWKPDTFSAAPGIAQMMAGVGRYEMCCHGSILVAYAAFVATFNAASGVFFSVSLWPGCHLSSVF